MSQRYYGKYRGMVLNNVDPMQQGRLQVQVPDVAGLVPASWAMPCVPIAGLQNGMVALPVIGSGVWVEFEQGNPDSPIWVGCFWGSAAEVPALALAVIMVLALCPDMVLKYDEAEDDANLPETATALRLDNHPRFDLAAALEA